MKKSDNCFSSSFRAIVRSFSSKLPQNFGSNSPCSPSTSAILQRHVFTPPPVIRRPRHHHLQQQLGNISDEDDHDKSTLVIFNVEETLLKSTSLFPYFMLVAFEGGGPVRAIMLFLMYPLICLLGKKVGLKIMVMVSFFGIKEEGFRVGKSVLPKFFLEDVGLEGYKLVKRSYSRKEGEDNVKIVGISSMPQVMIESFLTDYLEISHANGRKLKVFRGYYIGLMEEDGENKGDMIERLMINCTGFSDGDRQQMRKPNVVGVFGSRNSLLDDDQLISICKEIYIVNEAERKNWQALPRDRYPKPLIFHDGRLVMMPDPNATLALAIWAPFGFLLALIRAAIVIYFPTKFGRPFLAALGLRLLISRYSNEDDALAAANYNTSSPTTQVSLNYSSNYARRYSKGGTLYVFNHRTLFDPIFFLYALDDDDRKRPLTALTYSLSRVSEILSPIKTARLTRRRDRDANLIRKLLDDEGDLIICPEGTTCREPYLLRFSPLFAEMTNNIVPVALDCKVTMLFGTTASGFKGFDPLFFLMNPHPSYTVQLLKRVQGSLTVSAGWSRFDVANQVQRQVADALGFQCTKFTRKDKYMVLAGNEGVVSTPSSTCQ